MNGQFNEGMQRAFHEMMGSRKLNSTAREKIPIADRYKPDTLRAGIGLNPISSQERYGQIDELIRDLLHNYDAGHFKDGQTEADVVALYAKTASAIEQSRSATFLDPLVKLGAEPDGQSRELIRQRLVDALVRDPHFISLMFGETMASDYSGVSHKQSQMPPHQRNLFIRCADDLVKGLARSADTHKTSGDSESATACQGQIESIKSCLNNIAYGRALDANYCGGKIAKEVATIEAMHSLVQIEQCRIPVSDMNFRSTLDRFLTNPNIDVSNKVDVLNQLEVHNLVDVQALVEYLPILEDNMRNVSERGVLIKIESAILNKVIDKMNLGVPTTEALKYGGVTRTDWTPEERNGIENKIRLGLTRTLVGLSYGGNKSLASSAILAVMRCHPARVSEYGLARLDPFTQSDPAIEIGTGLSLNEASETFFASLTKFANGSHGAFGQREPNLQPSQRREFAAVVVNSWFNKLNQIVIAEKLGDQWGNFNKAMALMDAALELRNDVPKKERNSWIWLSNSDVISFAGNGGHRYQKFISKLTALGGTLSSAR